MQDPQRDGVALVRIHRDIVDDHVGDVGQDRGDRHRLVGRLEVGQLEGRRFPAGRLAAGGLSALGSLGARILQRVVEGLVDRDPVQPATERRIGQGVAIELFVELAANDLERELESGGIEQGPPCADIGIADRLAGFQKVALMGCSLERRNDRGRHFDGCRKVAAVHPLIAALCRIGPARRQHDITAVGLEIETGTDQPVL